MVEQHPKPSYSEIMRELGIEIISPNNSLICPFNSMNPQKNAEISKIQKFKIKSLKTLRFQENRCIFLSFQDNEFKIAIISLNRQKGGFYT